MSTACPRTVSIPARARDVCATIVVVTNATALRDIRVEQVSLHIYELAYRTMEVITRRFVDQELEWLRSHPPACRCSDPCQAARDVAPSRVFWTARTWQNSITVKRVHRAGPRR